MIEQIGFDEMEATDPNAAAAPEGAAEGESTEMSPEDAVGKALDMIPPEMIIEYLKKKEVLPPDFELPKTEGTESEASDIAYSEMEGTETTDESADMPLDVTGVF